MILQRPQLLALLLRARPRLESAPGDLLARLRTSLPLPVFSLVFPHVLPARSLVFERHLPTKHTIANIANMQLP